MIYKFGEMHIVFTEQVVRLFDSYKQRNKKQHEAGGVLLGKVYNDLILVDRVSEPTKGDKSGLYYFYRNVHKAQEIIKTAWEESSGERIYLGEWHTHPEENAHPSKDDKSLISNMLNDSYMEIDFLFMVIIGVVKPFVAVHKRDQLYIEELAPLKSSDGLDITLYENKKSIVGFKVVGYLNIGPIGNDIYNAAFSQIFFGTINSILTLTEVSDYILEQEKAFIKFIVPKLNLNEEKDIVTLLEGMKIQIRMLINEMEAKQLEKHVCVKTNYLV
ncbi:ribosomal-processing cysteine protease Prp [Evansella halocellulosilytica]|uniref:ribosomal-processing cysteine protease Prp n=1 Tax=Evansella halocellulosilytica TaxID=2011013 RepID=UPI000BB8B302|nr:ribosomal-processing cysteine protease Prp [Evansella halocellulosilytica]